MRSIKIGIVAPMVVQSATGLSNYVTELVPELCDAGHKVTVLATNCAYRGAPADDIVAIDSRCTTLLFPSTGRLSRRVYHSAELSAWLRKNVHRFDIIDIQGLWFWSTVHAARACISAGTPYVITPHGMMGHWDWAKRPWAKKIFFRTMLADCWRCAAAIRYLSQGELSNSQIRPAGPAAIIPAAISLPPEADPERVAHLRRRLNIRDSDPIVLFLGRVNPQKGVLELVQAFDLISQRCPEAVLVVAGALEGEYGDIVQESARKLQSGGRVHILGRVSAEHKATLLAAASIFVTLSRNEGMSSAILEALGQGVPAVCTADSNIPEIVEYSAGLITELDVAKAADTISGLLKDEGRRRAMGFNARKMVSERFTWKSIIPQLIALYETLIPSQSLVAERVEEVVL